MCITNLPFPQKGRLNPILMCRKKEELQFLAKLGERKIKSLKNAYELTESELLVIIRLHKGRAYSKNNDIINLLKKF